MGVPVAKDGSCLETEGGLAHMPDMRLAQLHPLRWLGQRDRGFAALRRATRTAIIMPAMFAVGDKVIGNPQVATFAAFGSFAMLLLVDFGGPMAERLQAQAALDPFIYAGRHDRDIAGFDAFELGQSARQPREPRPATGNPSMPKPNPGGLDLERLPDRDRVRASERRHGRPSPEALPPADLVKERRMR